MVAVMYLSDELADHDQDTVREDGLVDIAGLGRS